MSEPTIDLSRGLEAWFDFGSRYYDNQRGIVQDKSGYGRHAEASGGPTVGVDGPAAFEATSFDGTDDYFTPGTPISQDGEQFFYVLFKPESTFGTLVFTGLNSDGMEINFDGQGDLTVSAVDQSGVTHTAVAGRYETDQWLSVVAGYDDEDLLCIETKTGDIDRVAAPSHAAGLSDYQVGRRGGGGAEFTGQIAIAATWFRTLSWTEIQHLDRLTAPRRAML